MARTHAAHAAIDGSSPASGTAPGKRPLTAQLAPRTLQAKGAASGAIDAPPSGGGAALDPAVAARAGATLGHDFSSVRVHTGGHADALGTRAFAYGDDLHFAAGAYDPSSAGGASLLGHELTHVAQQRDGQVAPTGAMGGVAVNTDPSLEAAADAGGARVAQGFDLGGFLDFAPRTSGAIANPVAQGEALASQGAATASAAPVAGAVPPEVLARIGARFHHTDDRSAVRHYTILAGGGFEMIPPTTAKEVGKKFLPSDTGAKKTALQTLCAYVVAHAAELPPTVAPPAAAEPPTTEAPAADDGLTLGGLLSGAVDAVTGAVQGAIDAGKAFLGDVSAIIDAALGNTPADGVAPAPSEPTTGEPGVEPAPGEPAPGEPAAPGEPTDTGALVMSQFRWYGFDGRALNVDETLAAAKTISDNYAFGGTVAKVTDPAADVKSKNGNHGYFWFTAEGTPIKDGNAGGTQYVTFTIKDGETSGKAVPLTMYLSNHGPGDRPAQVTVSEKVTDVPPAVQDLDLRNIPGLYSCLATSASMMAAAGVHAVGSKDASLKGLVTAEQPRDWNDAEKKKYVDDAGQFDAAKAEEKVDREIKSITPDEAQAKKAKAYFEFETQAGRPFLVGVTYKDHKLKINEGITDHWVVLNGRVSDGKYTFLDPGNNLPADIASAANVIEWDGTKLHKPLTNGCLYVVSWVRPNEESLTEWNAHWAQQENGAGAPDAAPKG